jgi:4-amino-4-deoxy-L-arabinose transferase-like glycosyltransferase
MERGVGSSAAGPPASRRQRWLLALIFALCAAAGIAGNGADRPLASHEVLVARTAAEMQRERSWLVPLFNGEPRLQKPPIAYWCAIVSSRLAGEPAGTCSEFSARLPAALAGAALVLVVFALARSTFASARAGIAAAAVWATSAGCMVHSHNAQPEMLYTLFCALAMSFFVRQAQSMGNRIANAWLAWLMVALAVLTKGPFLPCFMLLGVGLALVAARRRAPGSPALRSVLWPWTGAGLVLGVAGGYFALVALREPGAVEFWRKQMFERTGGVSAAWWQPFKLHYVRAALEWSAPWWFLVPFAVSLVWRTNTLAVRMVAWAFCMALACLSFSAGAKAYYLLPAMPLACVLLGGAAEQLCAKWDGTRKLVTALRAHGGLAFLAAVVVAGMPLIALAETTTAQRTATVAISLVALLALAASGYFAARNPERAFVGLWLASQLVVLGALISGEGWAEGRFEEAEFARAVASATPAGSPLAESCGGVELLVYYGDRRVEPVQENELSSWSRHHPQGLVLIRRGQLEAGKLRGTVVLAERAPGPDARILLKPDLEPSSSVP